MGGGIRHQRGGRGGGLGRNLEEALTAAFNAEFQRLGMRASSEEIGNIKSVFDLQRLERSIAPRRRYYSDPRHHHREGPFLGKQRMPAKAMAHLERIAVLYARMLARELEGTDNKITRELASEVRVRLKATSAKGSLFPC